MTEDERPGQPECFFDNEVGGLDAAPSPLPEFVFEAEQTPSDQLAVRQIRAAEAGQFSPLFGPERPLGVLGDVAIVEDVPGFPPIEPGEGAFTHLQQPGSVSGQYGNAFELQQLRDAMGTDRYTYEAKRMRSKSPCRLCKHGSELWGVASMKSQTYTGIARRILCDRFKTDVTENMILKCDGFEDDEVKHEKPPIREVEKELRSQFKLTAPPPTRWDAEEAAEEVAVSNAVDANKPLW